ncbi:hypothetical protein OAG68_01805 [bacterium]|nr:hypothetical protein [bacterium]
MSEKIQHQFTLKYGFALTAVVAIGMMALLQFQQQIGTAMAIPFAIWTATISYLLVQVIFSN